MTIPDEPPSDSPSDLVEADDPVTLIASQSVSYTWLGPPPQILDQYERIVPGSAQDALRDWHDSMAHRRRVERDETNAVAHTVKWTAAYRLATIIVIITGGLLAILLGEPAMGWFLGLSAALSYPVGSALVRILRGRGRDENSSSDQSKDP